MRQSREAYSTVSMNIFRDISPITGFSCSRNSTVSPDLTISLTGKMLYVFSSINGSREGFSSDAFPSSPKDLLFCFALHDFRSRLNIVIDPDISSDLRTVPDYDASEDCRTGINGDIVLHDRVPGDLLYREPVSIKGKALGSQSYSLIYSHMVPNDAGFADDDSRAVVHEEVFTDFRPWMNINACLGMCNFCDDPRNQGNSQLVELMRDSVVGERPNTRIAKDYFPLIVHGRVTIESRLNVCGQQTADIRKALDEL
ncbi:hypothetical protein SCFA_500003 [anaerobic digester metagenome]|uniref:Uncharacterized protein n=1 Tax=anaerobic digester metagenome TaxID=1263854 RepID=A0A485M3H1_9ZZZZ